VFGNLWKFDPKTDGSFSFFTSISPLLLNISNIELTSRAESEVKRKQTKYSKKIVKELGIIM
jgi:hypothetical protein